MSSQQLPDSFSQDHYGSQYPPGPHAMSEGHQQHLGTLQNPGWEWGLYGPNPHSPSPTTVQPGAYHPNNYESSSQPLLYQAQQLPGTTQNKRPRRRFDQIERIYKCGWNDCQKAYGTLAHLNAHVTMNSHGVKRTVADGRKIREEWKKKKKEEEEEAVKEMKCKKENGCG
ncbi:hypothetical protein FPQ18DRAFT_290050 [Pyronema domesticum]|nr:hypothetical protein FPQ18DRAFT_290050 [Pyronema domesticum]